jgi:hypothetical protein
MTPRPGTIPIVAAFLLLATAIAGVAGASLLVPNPLTNRLWELNPAAAGLRELGSVLGIFLLGLGTGTAAAAIGLLQRKKWAWWFAVTLFAVNGCGDVVSLYVTGDPVRGAAGVAVAAAFLYYLTRPSVRSYFKESN